MHAPDPRTPPLPAPDRAVYAARRRRLESPAYVRRGGAGRVRATTFLKSFVTNFTALPSLIPAFRAWP